MRPRAFGKSDANRPSQWVVCGLRINHLLARTPLSNAGGDEAEAVNFRHRERFIRPG